MIKKNSLLKNDKIALFIFYLASLICMVSINAGNYSYSKIAYLIIGFISVFITLETNIIMLFCLLPFPRLFLYNQAFFTLIPIIELIIVFKWITINRIDKIELKNILICLLILFHSSFIEYLRYSSFFNSIEFCLKLLVILAISSVANRELAKKAFGLLVVSSLLSVVASQIFPALTVSFRTKEVFYSTRFNGLLGDAGEFGQMMLCSIACCISYFVIKAELNEKKITITNIVSIVFVSSVSIYYMILSGTRTCLIGIGVIYIIILIWLIKGKTRREKALGYFCLVISLIVGYYVWQLMFNIFMQSHGGEKLSDDNRTMIWLHYLNEFKNDVIIQIFGVGMDCSNTYGSIHGLGNPHNVFIEKIFECGLVGLIINGCFFTNVFKNKKGSLFEKSNLPFYVFLSTLFFYGSVGIELIYFLIGLMLPKNEGIAEMDNLENRENSINLGNGRGLNVKRYS